MDLAAVYMSKIKVGKIENKQTRDQGRRRREREEDKEKDEEETNDN